MSIFDLFKEISKKDDNIPRGPAEYIIVGLGNPGMQYEKTRHNSGFMVVDRLAERMGFSFSRYRFHAKTAEVLIAGKKCLIMKPETYMNNSGEAVEEARAYYKMDMEHVIVIYDDISLEPGTLRIRRKGSHGGHNGIKSVIELTGEDIFPRIKMGVGKKPHPKFDLADWVLGRFNDEDAEKMKASIENACDCIELLVQGKTDEAMNKFNS